MNVDGLFTVLVFLFMLAGASALVGCVAFAVTLIVCAWRGIV